MDGPNSFFKYPYIASQSLNFQMYTTVFGNLIRFVHGQSFR